MTDTAGPRFAWSGTGFAAQFLGTSIGVNLNNDDAYFFQAVVDGTPSSRFQVAKGQAVRTVVSGLASGVHTLELYRETEGMYGASQLLGITEATLLAPPSSPARLLEFVGDSMSAGYGNLGSEPHPNYEDPNPCTFTYDTESAYLSYGAVTARALGAEASLIAVSGWGVLRGRTSDVNEVLPKVYADTLGLATSPTWDFGVQPQAVVVNLGTNDFVPGDPGTAYTTALSSFIDTVRAKYPAAWIFCAIGTMYTTAEAAQAQVYVQAAVASHGGDAGKVAFVDLGSQDALQGTGCDWHPNVAEDQRMADTLVPVIKQKLNW
jgi:lysophospholipase L1-like esterase